MLQKLAKLLLVLPMRIYFNCTQHICLLLLSRFIFQAASSCLKLEWSWIKLECRSGQVKESFCNFTLRVLPGSLLGEVLMVSVKWGDCRNVGGECTSLVLKNNTNVTHTQPAFWHRFRLWFWWCHRCLNWTGAVWVTDHVCNKEQW